MKGGAGDNEIGKEGDRKKRFPALYEHDIAIGLFFFLFFFYSFQAVQCSLYGLPPPQVRKSVM